MAAMAQTSFQAETWQEIGLLKQTLRQEAFDFVLDSQGLIKARVSPKWQNPIYGLDKHSARERLAAVAYTKTYAVPKGKMPFGVTASCSPKYLGMRCLKRRYSV